MANRLSTSYFNLETAEDIGKAYDAISKLETLIAGMPLKEKGSENSGKSSPSGRSSRNKKRRNSGRVSSLEEQEKVENTSLKKPTELVTSTSRVPLMDRFENGLNQMAVQPMENKKTKKLEDQPPTGKSGGTSYEENEKPASKTEVSTKLEMKKLETSVSVNSNSGSKNQRAVAPKVTHGNQYQRRKNSSDSQYYRRGALDMEVLLGDYASEWFDETPIEVPQDDEPKEKLNFFRDYMASLKKP